LPKRFSDITHKGIDVGLRQKALTVLIELLEKTD